MCILVHAARLHGAVVTSVFISMLQYLREHAKASTTPSTNHALLYSAIRCIDDARAALNKACTTCLE
jgi:hypothetical protein